MSIIQELRLRRKELSISCSNIFEARKHTAMKNYDSVLLHKITITWDILLVGKTIKAEQKRIRAENMSLWVYF